jgi:CheY-like chemotaxis protein
MAKVFLIDDDNIVIYLTKLVINESLPELEVVPFEYATEALEALQELVEKNQPFPEYILLDINMPMVDGWDFLEVYQKFPCDKRAQCKLMMHSSSLDPAEEIKSRTYTCVADFVAKPITTERLPAVFSIAPSLENIQ